MAPDIIMIHEVEAKLLENLSFTNVLGSPIDFASFEPPFFSGLKEKVLHLTTI